MVSHAPHSNCQTYAAVKDLFLFSQTRLYYNPRMTYLGPAAVRLAFDLTTVTTSNPQPPCPGGAQKKTVRTRSVSKHKSSTPPTAVRSQQDAGGSERAQEGVMSRGAVQDHRAPVCSFSTTHAALTPFSYSNFYLPTKGQMWSKSFFFNS